MLAVLADMSPDPGARDNFVTVAENAYLLYLLDPTVYLLSQISTSSAWHWLPFVYILLCKYVRASAAAGPDSRFDYEETVLVVVDGSAVAIAEAIVTATIDASNRCHVSVDTGSGTVHPATPTPAPGHTPGGHVDTHAPHPAHAHTPPAPAPTRPTPAPRSGRKRSSHPKRRHAKRGHKGSKKGGRKVAKKGGHRGARKVARKPVRKPVRKGGRKIVPKGGRRGGHKVQQKRLRKGGSRVERKGGKSAKRRAPRRRPRRGHAA